MILVQRFLCNLLAVACLLWAASAQAATYYVSLSGSDGRSCSQAQSASTPMRTISSGANCLGAGDTLYVRSGTYNESLVNIPVAGSSWGSPVRIASYPGETVWLMPSSGSYVLYLASGQRYVEFDGINMDARS